MNKRAGHNVDFMESDDDFEPGENKSRFRVWTKIMFGKDKPIFGPGPLVLLKHISETGSVRTACQEMTLSYSKAWQILNQLEEDTGFAVIVRHHGGAGGGSSELTDKGRYLVERYEVLCQETKQAVDRLFDQIFVDLPEPDEPEPEDGE